MARLPETRQLTKALYRHTHGMIHQNVAKMQKALVVDDEPLTVELLNSDIRIDEDHLLLGSWSRYYDSRYTIDVGDALIVTPLNDSDGDWFVSDVLASDDFDLADHPEDGDYDPVQTLMGKVLGQIPYKDQDGSDIGTLLTYDPNTLNPLVGVPFPWLVSAIPTGFLEFNGQSISTAYPKLRALFGTTLPDLRDLVLLGASGTHPVGSQGGGSTASIQSGTGGATTVVTSLPPYRAVRWITVAA